VKFHAYLFIALAAISSACHSPVSDLKRARREARLQGKLLMVQFGADWCPDCRALSKELDASSDLTQHFVRLNIDVGEFNRNLDVAKSVGLDVVESGIPAAAFFTPDGAIILITQHGELARASQEGSESLRRFLEEIRRKATPRFPQPSS
jgi:protein disulfide-isomerase